MSAVTLSTVATVFPHTGGLEYYKKFKARYRLDQTEEPVKEKFKIMFEEVMDDLNLKQEVRKKLRIFNVYGYDMFHAGTVMRRRGGIVGIPMNFEYESVNTINKNDIQLNDKPVPWHQQEAKDFLESLVLSERAKKFAIAREILKVKEYPLDTNLITYTTHILLMFFIYKMLRKRMVLAEQKMTRFLTASVISVGGIAGFLGLQSSSEYKSDFNVDIKLSQLGPEYTEGGKEFYEKLLKRNIALRTLLGERGKKLFTVTGNETYLLWPKSISLYDRKSFFETGA